MSRTSQSGLAAQKTPAPVATSAKSHFDTFETRFFEQGDAGETADGERMEEWDEPTRPGRVSASRPFLLGVAVGGLSVALLGGVGLWLGGFQLGGQAPAPAPAAPAAVVAATQSVPAPAAPAPSAAVAPLPPSAAVQPSEPAPSPASPQPAVAVDSDPPAATAPVAALPAAADPVVAEPEEPAAEPSEAPAPAAEAEAAPSPTQAEAVADDALASCKQAIDHKRNKEALAICPAAFAADPTAADIALALARMEFNRGRSTRAIEWGRKAIALDESLADAYVFVGGGEQIAGHGKAAKAAYRRYLELAPRGRYAVDVRAILSR